MSHTQPASAPSPAVILSPIRAGIPVSGAALEVLLRVQAPAQPPESAHAGAKARAPMRLALVVDRSGSMSGQPLTEALRCVKHIVDRLQPTDQVAVVLYDDEVQRPVPLRAATDAAAVQATLDGVESGGSTNLFSGWEAGARQLESGTKDSISRVILLSDGQANQGLLDQAQIEQHCARWLGTGVSTTTVGLGRGFNEDLMIGMARAGGGQQYYGQTAQDLFDGFDEELALLEAMVLRRLRIKLIAAPGVIVEPLGLVQKVGDETYALPDLAWGAESWLLVRLHVSAAAATDGRSPMVDPAARALLSAVLQAESVDGIPLTVAAPMLQLQPMDNSAWNDLPVDDMVAQRLLEVQMGETGAQVRSLLLAGDSIGAGKLLRQMEASAAAHPWLKDKVQRLKDLTERDAVLAQKELRYNRVKMSSRLASDKLAQYSADETERADIPAYLRRKSSEGRGRKS